MKSNKQNMKNKKGTGMSFYGMFSNSEKKGLIDNVENKKYSFGERNEEESEDSSFSVECGYCHRMLKCSGWHETLTLALNTNWDITGKMCCPICQIKRAQEQEREEQKYYAREKKKRLIYFFTSLILVSGLSIFLDRYYKELLPTAVAVVFLVWFTLFLYKLMKAI